MTLKSKIEHMLQIEEDLRFNYKLNAGSISPIHENCIVSLYDTNLDNLLTFVGNSYNKLDNYTLKFIGNHIETASPFIINVNSTPDSNNFDIRLQCGNKDYTFYISMNQYFKKYLVKNKQLSLIRSRTRNKIQETHYPAYGLSILDRMSNVRCKNSGLGIQYYLSPVNLIPEELIQYTHCVLNGRLLD